MEHIYSSHKTGLHLLRQLFLFVCYGGNKSVHHLEKNKSKPINDIFVLFIGQFNFQIMGEII